MGSVLLEGPWRPLAGAEALVGLGQGSSSLQSLNPLLRDQEMRALLWPPNHLWGPNRLRLLPLHLPLHGPHMRRRNE